MSRKRSTQTEDHPRGGAAPTTPPTTRWLVGHVSVGVAVMVGMLIASSTAAAVVYGLLLVTVVPIDARQVDVSTRRARGFWRRVGWSLLLPFHAIGLAVHAFFELLGALGGGLG